MNNYIFPEELDNFSVDGAEAIITATADGNRVQFTQEGVLETQTEEFKTKLEAEHPVELNEVMVENN